MSHLDEPERSSVERPAVERPAVAEVRSVSKASGAVAVLEGVDLSLLEGTITVLVGGAGSGKTTLLRAIAGLDDIDEGEIHIAGEQVTGPTTWVPPHRRRLGWAGGGDDLFAHLDVAGNVGYGVARRQRRDRARQLLSAIGMPDSEGRTVSSLSVGEARRVAWARAVAPKPRLVLLDEPLAGIDVERPGALRALLALLRAEGATTLLATSDSDLALTAADQIAVLVEGRLLQTGPPEEVYREPVSPDAALALGDVNLLEGDVRAKLLYSAAGPIRVDAPDGRVVAVVRPEDLELEAAPRGDGRVVDVEYFGHGQRVAVLLDDGTPVRARLHARRPFTVGTRVRVRHSGAAPKAFSVDRPVSPPE